jgi:hypothetical protein
MRRYSPNGEIQLDFAGQTEPCNHGNGDLNNRDHHVRFGGQSVADSQHGVRTSGYM